MNTELLLKYIEGDISDDEKLIVIDWLDSDLQHMKEYLALRKLNDIMIWQSFDENRTSQEPKKKQSAITWKLIYTESAKIAAILIIAVLIARFLIPEFKNETSIAMQTLNIPSGQRAEIILEDGTKVWLNAKSTLKFPSHFSDKTRQVSLDGEGYFEVTANKSKPFIVKTEKYDVKVWGTKFNLISYSRKRVFETALFEGSVEVLKSGETKGLLIKPNEQVFDEGNHLEIAPIKKMNHFLWKDGIISFEDDSFSEMASKLELYFDVKIEIDNNELLKYRCTGKFRTKDGVEHILKVIQLRNNFSFKVDEKNNIINIK